MGMLDIWDLEIKIIGRSESWIQLRESFSSLLKEIEKQGHTVSPYDQVGAISAAYREATRKVCDLIVRTEFDERISTNDYAFLSLGGEARREVTLKFDQDNAIVFGRDDPALVAFSERVVERLAWLGFEECPGGIMASRPQWQGTLDAWLARIRFLCGDGATKENVRVMTALFDIDFVAGNERFFDRIVEEIRTLFPRSARAQRVLAEDILDIPPYIGIFGRLIKESRRDRKGLFNFKYACLYPFVGILRIESWRNGISRANTRARIRSLKRAGIFSGSQALEMERVFEHILGLRLAQQRYQKASGLQLSDYFTLELFNKEELAELRRCVRYVEGMKKRLRWLYWV
jgi:CBS domain-containing protein